VSHRAVWCATFGGIRHAVFEWCGWWQERQVISGAPLPRAVFGPAMSPVYNFATYPVLALADMSDPHTVASKSK